MSKHNHKNKIRNKEKVIILDLKTIVVYVGCILFLFLLGKFFIMPIKTILKLIGNSILGGILIFIVNVIGVVFNFHIGLNIGTALITGILGIPRSCFAYLFKNISILSLLTFYNTKSFYLKKGTSKLKCLFVFYYFLLSFLSSFIISFAAPIVLNACVASNGINTLFASPLATSFSASNDFNCTSFSSGFAFFIALYTI